jgi:ectoine hydroxylase-related dioxygenase (phytanoyl-CoA dioxygenase family)
MSVSEITVGELRTANHLLNDFEELSALYHEEGYLFFRNVLDERAVLRAKQEFVGVLQQQGVAKVNEAEAIWTGAGLDQIDDDVLYALDGYQKLLDLESTRRFIEAIFAEPVFMYQNVDIRFALPNDEKHLTPSHQDHFFIRQTERFRTVWIPLMPVERKVGGLAVAARSHLRGLLEHVEHETAYSYIFRGRKQRGVPLESIHQTWLTADYRPGDLLMFHSLMIHRALPNGSDRIRLSLDTRYQPLSEPRTWQAEKTILELRQYRRSVREIAFAEGASEPLFESVLIEMMKQGLEAERKNVTAVMQRMC